jgi:hypothetical protein
MWLGPFNMTAGDRNAVSSSMVTTINEFGNPRYMEGLPGIRPPPVAPTSPECGALEADAGGHWGEPRVGWRLSVRLGTNRFSPEDIVPVYATLRNVSSTNLQLSLGKCTHSLFCDFEVKKDTRCIGQAQGGVSLMKSFSRTVPPMTQYRTWARVKALSDLNQPGHYRIRGVAAVPVFDTQSNRLLYYTNVVSGYAEFEVLPSANDVPSAPRP